MDWLILAAVSAVSQALYFSLNKNMVRGSGAWWSAVWVSIFIAVFSGALVFIQGIPILTNGFWPAFGIELVLEAAALVMVFKAFEKAEASLITPLLALTPVFLLVTSPLITGETPNAMGIIGILLTVIGTYLLTYQRNQRDVLEPFRAILSNEGTRWMLAVAILYSLTGNFFKLVVIHSSPAFTEMAISIGTGLEIALLAIFLKHKPKRIPFSLGAISGLLTAASSISLGYALTSGLTPYVISIRRLSAPLTVILGGKFLQEKGTSQRLLASLISVAGVILILFAG